MKKIEEVFLFNMLLVVIFLNMPNWMISTIIFIKSTSILNEFDSDDAFVCAMTLIMNASIITFTCVKIS